jgi:hypothetical protein
LKQEVRDLDFTSWFLRQLGLMFVFLGAMAIVLPITSVIGSKVAGEGFAGALLAGVWLFWTFGLAMLSIFGGGILFLLARILEAIIQK